MNRNPIEMEHYRREPRVYKFINWLCAAIFCGLVLALWTGVLK